MAVQLSESAANHIKQHLAEKQATGLRLGIKKTGCSGWAYVVDYAAGAEEGDSVFKSNGVDVFVNNEHLSFLDGLVLDYVKQGINSTFKFDNPNVKDECGCGESFTI